MKLLIGGSLLFLSSLIFEGVPSIRQAFFNDLQYISELNSIIAAFFLVILGMSLILIGLPFIFFEVAMGYIHKDYLRAVIIVMIAKALGASLSFLTTRHYLKD
jgi:hypothetical protein